MQSNEAWSCDNKVISPLYWCQSNLSIESKHWGKLSKIRTNTNTCPFVHLSTCPVVHPRAAKSRFYSLDCPHNAKIRHGCREGAPAATLKVSVTPGFSSGPAGVKQTENCGKLFSKSPGKWRSSLGQIAKRSSSQMSLVSVGKAYVARDRRPRNIVSFLKSINSYNNILKQTIH